MAKFRKKPVVIEAVQFTQAMAGDREPPPDGVERRVDTQFSSVPLVVFGIQTLEGFMTVSVGDWVITGVKGEKYPCKDEIFRLTYEPQDESVPWFDATPTMELP